MILLRQESEEVIKKVIKNHQETTQNKVAQASPKKSALSFIRSGHQMPGRVMRQGEFSNSKSQDLTSKLSTQQQSSSSAGASRDVDSKSANSVASKSSSAAAASSLAAMSLNEGQDKDRPVVASSVSSRSVHQNPSFVNPYASAAPRDPDEDQSKLDKFSRILSQNPVNLGKWDQKLQLQL